MPRLRIVDLDAGHAVNMEDGCNRAVRGFICTGAGEGEAGPAARR